MVGLAEFLRTRRARISPQSVGLPGGSRRRVAGLRREELAQLAGISVEYYQRLEQGRASHPSDQVLDAIGDVLRLSPVERDHLRVLTSPAYEVSAPAEQATVRPELARLLGMMAVPALVVTDRFDVLAVNELARRLFVRSGENWNLARFLFLDPAGRDFYVEWDEVAAATAAQLRAVAAHHPHDAELAALLGELRAGSAEFSALWAAGDVEKRTHGTKSFRHPALGVLVFDYENFAPTGDSRQRLVTFSPPPGTPTEAALQLLSTWSTAPTADRAEVVPLVVGGSGGQDSGAEAAAMWSSR
jgi:transcriptional regulator with XRE-family HTH domain